jgi:fructosamine-3-kinase
LWQRILEQRIEMVRKKMEDTAVVLGLGHPKVYYLGQELDRLHNQWEKEYGFQRKQTYGYDTKPQYVKESNQDLYKIVV